MQSLSDASLAEIGGLSALHFLPHGGEFLVEHGDTTRVRLL
jgi:hypothetical protein